MWSEGREWAVFTVVKPNLRIRSERPGYETSGENAGLSIFQSALTSHQAQLWLGYYETQSPTLFHRSPVALRSRNSLTVCSEDTEGNQLTLQDTFKSRTLRRTLILKPCVELCSESEEPWTSSLQLALVIWVLFSYFLFSICTGLKITIVI